MFEWLRIFWSGRILFLARGEQLARFVNLVSKEGIILYHTQKSERGMRAQIELADFRRLRRAARRTHTRIHIIAKYGWPFIAARWWRRKGLLVGILIIAFFLTVLSQLVLSISVLGNKNLSSSDVLERAEKLGLKTWVYSKKLDLNTIAKALQDQLPDAAWIGIERHGTSIQIRVSEKIRPSIPDEAGNLVASHAGIVKEIMVIEGTPLVHEGETVRAGQVLIKSPEGNTMEANGASSPSVARGFVRARVWYSAEAKIPLVEDKVEESGRVAIGRGIKIGSRVIMLTTQNSPFEQSRKEVIAQSLKLWRNWRFPVEGIRVNHIELRNVHIERSVTEARRLAEQTARAEVMKKIAKGVPIVLETVKILTNSSDSERIRVEVETYEDIAVYANP
ncbi:sporulation protein YqfD [Desulfosporosinus orientis DSM 765]|uniref:Sporulation protein YqfD n=1 Tax=Desulfosporosinus orientis (strain ATCC 19365 / DSM 765 / NCIMB 8382 / VKM B-1628 / Singapore I) TaxID=768706 RepID=G7WJ80_DESOD|nr:sporulation protein YqfD [Desulfosporosinus orientis]AET70392.1 sporulation protein YqfD [Desulfosporosinus orientis DSM 765]